MNQIQTQPITPTTIHNKIAELTAQGEDIIPLHIGEPDFPIPSIIQSAMYEAFSNGACDRYGTAGGIVGLKEACSDRLQQIGVPSLCYDASNIVIAPGGRYLIASVIELISSKKVYDGGINVLIPTPAWPAYATIVQHQGDLAVSLAARAENDYKITAKELRNALTQHDFDLFIFNNPNNPTGAIYTKQEVAEIAAILKQFPKCAILTDDVYASFVPEGSGYAHLLDAAPELFSHTYVIDSMSKAFSMTGERFGFAAVPQSIATELESLIGMRTTAVGSVAQAAALKAYTLEENGNAYKRLQTSYKDVKHTREAAIEMLKDTPYLTVTNLTGAFYLWVDAPEIVGKFFLNKEIESVDMFCSLLLEHFGVAVVPGSAFGEPNAFRISCAAKDTLEGIKRIQQFIDF